MVGAAGWGPAEVGARRAGGANISRFFFFLLPPIFALFSLSGGLLVGFWWCVKRRDPQVEFSGCRVNPGGGSGGGSGGASSPLPKKWVSPPCSSLPKIQKVGHLPPWGGESCGHGQ